MSLAAQQDDQDEAGGLPVNYEVEQALLAAVLANNAALERVADFLRPEHFADPLHGRIYEACRVLVDRGSPANAISLKGRFAEDEDLKRAPGGLGYLADLQASYVNILDAPHYAREIKDCWIRREGIRIARELMDRARCMEDDYTGARALEETEMDIFRLAEEQQGERGGLRPYAEAVRTYIDGAAAIHGGTGGGLKCGIGDLDAKLGGLHKTDLLILAGRPGMGKSALAVNVAEYVASHVGRGPEGQESPQPVAFFSLEMSADQIAGRILAAQSGVSSDDVRKDKAGHVGIERLMEAERETARTPLFIDDQPALNISQVRTRARRLKRRHGLALVVVDYLQLMAPVGRGREINRVQEVSEISRGLKALAKELAVPVLALSQLSRAVEQREDKHPLLSDLRESGSIEQDADVVIFAYRDEYYLEGKMPTDGDHKKLEAWQRKWDAARGTAELIVAKHRHGPTGTVRVAFDAQRSKFSDLARYREEDYTG